MFTAPCPGCGAALNFRSPASVMAVCAYCQTTALKDADSVRDLGKMSQVLDDFSPLQVGVSGRFDGQGFTLLGRLRMAYDNGRWSEWFAWFDDGSEGWLSEADGQYVFTREQGQADKAPAFAGLKPGKLFYWQDQPFRAADVRTARCIGGQGELPFRAGDGWEARTADFRVGNRFLTLDYSDGDTPVCYAGRAVTLEELHCQLLRDEAEVARDTGQERGKIQALDCPHCGSPIQYAVGMTADLVCPACHAEVGLSGDKATVLAIHEAMSSQSTLKLGDVGRFDGAEWTLIGFLKAKELGGEPSMWTEYLLFNLKKGFSWLVETSEGWETVQVLNEVPDFLDDRRIRYQGQTLTQEWVYRAQVVYAAGAFNWRVRVGDQTDITDYLAPNFKLSRETYRDEVTWSLSRREPASTVLGWFGRQPPPEPVARPGRAKSAPGELAGLFRVFSALLWLFNLPLIIFGNGSVFVTLIAWGVLWLFARTGD